MLEGKVNLNPKVKLGNTSRSGKKKLGAKILWDFQIQIDRMGITNQLLFVVVDKRQMKIVLVDMAIPGIIRRKDHEKLKKYQRFKGESFW